MCLWFWDGYVLYARMVLVISVASVAEGLYETVTNRRTVRELAKYACDVTVARRRDTDSAPELTKISSEGLVPGDMIVVPDNCFVPCDMVLLTGSCIVNESMLTGESVPVIKNCILPTSDIYDPQDRASATKHTLYSGTKVIQAREQGHEHCFALVTRTGYVTTKGALVRDVLYPRPTNFKFYQDSLIFVGVMALVGVLGFAGTFPRLVALGVDTTALVDKSLDLLTITVPPALPATMSVGVAFAIGRLRRSKIFCISPPRVNVSGMIQLMVFDKTGTLTEDGLQILGARGVQGALKTSEQQETAEETADTTRELEFTSFVETIPAILPEAVGVVSEYLQ